MKDTQLVRRGDCSVAKELPRGAKTTLAQRQSNRRLSLAVKSERIKRPRKPKASSTTSVLYGPNRAQVKGPIVFAPHSILNIKPTPIKRGESVTLRPKMKIWTPAMVASEGLRSNRRQRVKFTREQRISAAHEKAAKLKRGRHNE